MILIKQELILIFNKIILELNVKAAKGPLMEKRGPYAMIAASVKKLILVAMSL